MSSYHAIMMLFCRLIAILSFILLFEAESAFSTSYYVAPTGRDTNPGSLSFPWRTITKAANTLTAGDIVYIASGTYAERLIPKNSGSNGQFITFTVQKGADVVIDGAAITLPPYDSGLIQIENRNYIKISGVNVRNAGPNPNNAGIYVDCSDHIVVENSKTYNTVSSGIGVWNSTNVVIDNNVVERACNDGEQECITVAGTNGFQIENNHIHHGGPGTLGGEGIDSKDGSSNGKISGNRIHDLNRLGIYIEAWDKHTHTIEVSKNRVYNCLNDGIALASEMGGLLENIRVINNIVYNNLHNGIAITPNGPVTRPPMRNLFIINNTCVGNGDGSVANPWGGGIMVDNPNINALVIRNNIFSQNLLFQILIEVSVAQLSVDHNLINGFRGYNNEIQGSSFVKGNPFFLNSADGDFHLGSNSPAIDSGYALAAPKDDFDSLKRPQGRAYDLGAFEYKEQNRVQRHYPRLYSTAEPKHKKIYRNLGLSEGPLSGKLHMVK